MDSTYKYELLDKIKRSCHITSTAYDEELEELMDAAELDLGRTADIRTDSVGTDALLDRAIITYCMMHRINVDKDTYARLKASYDEQKSQLMTSSSYTDWGDDNA